MEFLIEIALELIAGLVELAIDEKRKNPKKKYKKVAQQPYKKQTYDKTTIFSNKEALPKEANATTKKVKNTGSHELEEGLRKQIPSYFSEKALYLMIILFIFYENDGKFSKDEKKQIKVFLERQKIALGDDQNKIIKKVARKKPSIKKINSLIQAQNINSLIVETTLTGLEQVLRDTPSYLKVVQELHKKIEKNDEYE